MVQDQSTPPVKDSILNDEMVREETLERLQKHLPIDVCGYKVSSEVILEVVTHAAVMGSSIEASCKELAVDMSANTVREHLHAQLQRDNLNDLEASVNDALRDKLPRRARRGVREVAIDLHDQPYYGEDDELTCRGEAKAGTTRFYRVATA